MTLAQAAALRPGTAADLEALLALRTRAVRAAVHPELPQRQIEAWAAWPMDGLAGALAAGRGGVTVSTTDAGIAGFSWTTRGTRPHLRSLYVEPALAGRGHGTALLAGAEHELRRDGFARLLIAATPNAVDWYRARGYVVETPFEQPLDDAQGSLVLRLFKMVKPLAG